MLHIVNFISEWRHIIMPVLCVGALAAVVYVIWDLWNGFKKDFF